MMEQVLVKNAMREKQMRQMRAPVLVANERRRRLRLILQESNLLFTGACPLPLPQGGQRIGYFGWYRDRINTPPCWRMFSLSGPFTSSNVRIIPSPKGETASRPLPSTKRRILERC